MTRKKRLKVYKKYGGRCAYCGRKIKFEEMQIDHFIAKRRSGYAIKFGLKSVNDFQNLMPSCRRCNLYKKALLPERFRSKMETLHRRLKKQYMIKIARDYGIVKFQKWDGLFYFERVRNESKIKS